ncbi:hypothetical protein OTK49_21475 [Vibrio coralliirubri]|uniref:hypothetical protein n=1 Tax=Vibrio coralliirubri TaxID=1516159 RepID=UPI00228475B9|nr:hypothetical protein [Vibrio coralliirubri]MCY9865093.1 hypothetical protein [Vibrio coralliirubri]
MSSGVRAFVEAKAHVISTCGVRGEFPFERGNYFTSSEKYYFVNLWYENLKHLLDNGYLEDGKIEVLLFKHLDVDKFGYAYVVDERVPKEALHEPYFCGIRTNVEIIRMHHKVPDDKCLCEVDEYKLLTTSGRDDKGLDRLWCCQCDTRFEMQMQRRDGVYRVQLEEDSLRTWVLAWQEGGEFKRIPCMTAIEDSSIVKIDVERIYNTGTGEQQGNSIPLDKFRFTGLIRSAPKK